MKRILLSILPLICLLSVSMAQEKRDLNFLPAVTVGSDTLPHQDLPAVDVFPKKNFKNKAEEQQYWRMVWRVKKVLPYAKEAAILLRKYEMEVPPNARNKDRRVYVKRAERELLQKYGDTMKKMSINDGRVLIKLIDRETSHVSYDIIHDLKGGVSAVFWQGVARIFGNNLKSKYDPYGEDRQIEQIVTYIEAGLI